MQLLKVKIFFKRVLKICVYILTVRVFLKQNINGFIHNFFQKFKGNFLSSKVVLTQNTKFKNILYNLAYNLSFV